MSRRRALASASVTYSQQDAAPGTMASVKIGDKTLDPTVEERSQRMLRTDLTASAIRRRPTRRW